MKRSVRVSIERVINNVRRAEGQDDWGPEQLDKIVGERGPNELTCFGEHSFGCSCDLEPVCQKVSEKGPALAGDVVILEERE